MQLNTSSSRSSGRSSSRRRSISSILNSARFDTFSLGVTGIDNRQAVIIEIGTILTKVGYAGEFVPRAIIRSEYIDNLGKPQKIFNESFKNSDEYHAFIKLFEIIFYKILLTVAKERRIVIVESVLEPTYRRDLIAKILFEIFDAPSILFAPSHLLATFPFGCSNALVIDVGYREALILPIIEGVTVLNNWESSAIGSKRVEERVRELLFKYGKIITSSGEEREISVADEFLLGKYRLFEDIVTRFCFVTTMERGKQIQKSGYNTSENIPKPPCEVRLPFGNEMIVVPGIVREWSAEVIFEHNDDIRSLPQLILDCVFRCPIDCRRNLLNGLILVGGSTCMKGFYARLQSELLELMTSNPYSSKLGSIKSVKFFLLPNTRIELYGNWLGGSMFGSLEILQYRSFSREEWLTSKTVPDWISRSYEISQNPGKER